ncbi:hypothetical protein [Flavivirga algicola]|uniref:DUF4240 domain-containing protein n=1 Tax=Flavivirga algicola TaxID=2729136 RepID=A0ABX1RZF1_9FLAO|nr:hypothetical protein [Flavivirga algicola]NMH88952.1 hypothetical protein [Flavivirga algicola]
MEALKIKIFDVLTEKITVSEFENWLYNSEEILENLKSNTFYFDLISINYKSKKWLKELNDLIKDKYDEDYLIILKIERGCLEICQSETPSQVYQTLSKLIIDFDYETDLDILWKFYSLYGCYDSFEGSMFNKCYIEKEAKFYSKQVLKISKNCKDYEEIKSVLSQDLIPFKEYDLNQTRTLKQKIFAFFKKS